MLDRFRHDVLEGTGTLAWLFYFGALGLMFWAILPAPHGFLIGALAGTLAAVRIEANGLRRRVEALERDAAAG